MWLHADTCPQEGTHARGHTVGLRIQWEAAA